MTPADAILVVGGSVAGVGVVDELRRLGERRPIILLEAQEHLPYDRPPLSKGVLTGTVSVDEIAFHNAGHYREIGVDVRLSAPVKALRPKERAVELASGEILMGEAVVIATGASPRRLPGTADGLVHVLRERSDAQALRTAMHGASSMAVIGGGFIGAEVASTATEAGLEVMLIEAAPLPLENRVGSQVARLLLDLHRRAGVQVRCGCTVEKVLPDGSGAKVVLADGEILAADLVVAGLGALPQTAWLAGSGLKLADGAVACDDSGHTSEPGVYAVGDAASWLDTTSGTRRRHEHWTSARDQARIVAHTLVGAQAPNWSESVPYVWSDQHGRRIQILGRPAGNDTIHLVHHDPSSGALLALYEQNGQLSGAVACNMAARIARLRPLLVPAAPIDAALTAARTVPARGVKAAANGAPASGTER